MNVGLFKSVTFTAASGKQLGFKVECDGFTTADWREIAAIVAPRILPFREVHGVPRGGVMLADSLRPYYNTGSKRILVVDDVWTTGGSMGTFIDKCVRGGASYVNRESMEFAGLVLFARGDDVLPPWVDAFWKLGLREVIR